MYTAKRSRAYGSETEFEEDDLVVLHSVVC